MKYLIAFYALLLSATASAQLTVDKFCEYHSQDMLCASAPVDTDGDGVPDDLDECPNDPSNTCNNPPSDIDGDNVPDDIDQCSATPAGVPVDAVGCALPGDPNEPSTSLVTCPEINLYPNTYVSGYRCDLPSDTAYDPYGIDTKGFYTWRLTYKDNILIRPEGASVEKPSKVVASFHASGGGPRIHWGSPSYDHFDKESRLMVKAQDMESYGHIESWGLSGYGTAQGVGSYAAERMCQLLDLVENRHSLIFDWGRGLTAQGQSMGGRASLQMPMIMCQRWRERLIMSDGITGHTLPRTLPVLYPAMGPDTGANSANWDKMDFQIQAPLDNIVQNIVYVHQWGWNDVLGMLNPKFLDVVRDNKISGSFTWAELTPAHGVPVVGSMLREPTTNKVSLDRPFLAFTNSTGDYPQDWYGKTVSTMPRSGHINQGLWWDHGNIVETASTITFPVKYVAKVAGTNDHTPGMIGSISVDVTPRWTFSQLIDKQAFSNLAPNTAYSWVFGSQSGTDTTDAKGLLTMNIALVSGDPYINLVVTK